MIDLAKLIRSFSFAFEGLKTLFASENNAKAHFLAAVLVVIAGFWVGLNPMEWVAIVSAIAAVIGAEAFNTAIETLSDHVQPNQHTAIKKVKDLAAAGVLMAALYALFICLMIFIPKIP